MIHFLCQSNWIISFQSARNKKSVLLKTLSAGGIIGDDFIRGNMMSSYSAVAKTPTEVRKSVGCLVLIFN
jgi:CRP-like cAMP-binding protein